MSVANKPSRANKDAMAGDFIGRAVKQEHEDAGLKEAAKSEFVGMRIDSKILERATKAAKRLGITRKGFFVQAAVKELEQMGM